MISSNYDKPFQHFTEVTSQHSYNNRAGSYSLTMPFTKPSTTAVTKHQSLPSASNRFDKFLIQNVESF